MKKCNLLCALAISFGFSSQVQAQVKLAPAVTLPAAINEASIRAAAVASFPEYLALLALPNDSIASAQDIQVNANQLEKLFQQRGFTTQQFAN